jgi:putative transcriptional regulator
MAGRAHLGVRPARFVWIAAAAALLASAAMAMRRPLFVPAQAETRVNQLAAGKILVARRQLLDPNFARTVVLILQHDEEGTAGLILNRQTKIPLSRLSKEMESAKGRVDPLYLGGPVEQSGLMALLRSRTKPEDAKPVVADVYLISLKAMLEKTMASGVASSVFRLYLGYAGWEAGQLEWEMGQEAWEILPANAGIVFDPHPESLWGRLAEEEEVQVASLYKCCVRPGT